MRDKRGQYNDVSIAFAIITGIVVGLRLCSKFIKDLTYGLDDYFIVATFLVGIPASVINPHGLTANGLGKDIWTVPFKQITDFLRFFYAMELVYFAQVALLKLSLLFFYLRIFPGNLIRRLIWSTIAFNFLFGAAFVFAGIFQVSNSLRSSLLRALSYELRSRPHKSCSASLEKQGTNLMISASSSTTIGSNGTENMRGDASM